jgi:2-oxoisovalerate dehydrogenase E1 component alpha subunit
MSGKQDVGCDQSRSTSFPEVPFHRAVDLKGNAVAALPGFAQDREELVKIYHWMVLTRAFDAKAVALQRTGRLGTYASSLGQEAVGVAVGSAMRREDVLLPSFRDQGAQLVRGVKMEELLAYWGGDERGSDFAGPREDFPICVPVASHAPHAAGVALAFRLRHEARIAVCVLGDGATSKGEFYEAMNFAGIWRLPLVFVINNNQWAISVPRSRQSATPTLAQKALAAGFAGEQVDGNDIIALKQRLESALASARDGGGPCLLEALTYRLGDHTTADDARRYREDDEVSAHWEAEPITRLRNYMAQQLMWDDEAEARLLAECDDSIKAAVEAYEARDPEPPEAMFDHLHERLPTPLATQRDAVAGDQHVEAEDV